MKTIIFLVCANFILGCKPKKTAPIAANALQASSADTVQSGWTGLTDQVDTKAWKVKELD